MEAKNGGSGPLAVKRSENNLGNHPQDFKTNYR